VKITGTRGHSLHRTMCVTGTLFPNTACVYQVPYAATVNPLFRVKGSGFRVGRPTAWQQLKTPPCSGTCSSCNQSLKADYHQTLSRAASECGLWGGLRNPRINHSIGSAPRRVTRYDLVILSTRRPYDSIDLENALNMIVSNWNVTVSILKMTLR
jgi:hypothetical protein